MTKSTTQVKAPKKLIEVALPLDDINAASAKEKSIRGGHPSAMHLWWARRPQAAARAVLFAQLVNDPGYERNLGRGVNKKEAAVERERLFQLIRKLVLWENSNNEDVLREAQVEILQSWRETCTLNRNHPQASELFNPNVLPSFHDPFSGGGAIPLEAQRLGLETYASDLNPVAVLISKAMVEIPPKFAGRAPVAPLPDGYKQGELLGSWRGASGLAEDVRRYGRLISDEAFRRIGHLYPQIEITVELANGRPDLMADVGNNLTVIAWLWARTVRSPNPAFAHLEVPLVSSFWLSSKSGTETYVEPVIDNNNYRFTVRLGVPMDADAVSSGTKLSRGSFQCIYSGIPIPYDFIDDEANANRMGTRLMAVVAEGKNGRVYLPPTRAMEAVARTADPGWKPDAPSRGTWASNAQGRQYGFRTFGDYFTPRQLVALTTFSELVSEARQWVHDDAVAAHMTEDGLGLDAGGVGANAYADALTVYLAMGIDKAADYNSNLVTWSNSRDQAAHVFTKQAIPMVWDFAEINPFAGAAGDLTTSLDGIARTLSRFQSTIYGLSTQASAQHQDISAEKIVSTDPPYYDNVGYADLSDFFYVWLRRMLRPVFPMLFATLAVPKAEELVATSFRHGGKENAEAFFLSGMTQAMQRLAAQAHPAFPVTIYYAFKASETKDSTITSPGWETFLEAVAKSGFSVSGTWPIRTERASRSTGLRTNALASSIILVCRKRDSAAASISRREFVREVNALLPEALDEMTRGGYNAPLAPVDLSQAIIGPGMAIFSKYSAVLEANGDPMTVRTALQLINRFLAEDDFDADTQFCLHWFETNGWKEGQFGGADVLARAKGTTVDGVRDAGVIASGRGSVRLLRYAEYPSEWSPETDMRLPVWEALHHLIRVLQASGESAAGALAAKMPARLESIRQLAYRLYTLCERQGWAEDARAYNELITSWSAVEAASTEARPVGQQGEFDY